MSICALLMGRAGSTGFPGKNLHLVLGRPMVAYPLLAARASRHVERLFVSTDCPHIKLIGRALGAEIIDRPAHLCTSQALGEDVFVHGYQAIQNRGFRPELVVLLMANAATVTADLIDNGIEQLLANPELDSAVSVSKYNMWSPFRARRVDGSGCLQPFLPAEAFAGVTCDRDSQGDVWFADMGVSVVRARCLEHLDQGLPPQKWMGQRIAPIYSWGGCDVDEPWQMAGVEQWLVAHGVTPA